MIRELERPKSYVLGTIVRWRRFRDVIENGVIRGRTLAYGKGGTFLYDIGGPDGIFQNVPHAAVVEVLHEPE